LQNAGKNIMVGGIHLKKMRKTLVSLDYGIDEET
jgi:hypothetical protein